MKKDYPELEGKIITLEGEYTTYKVIVVGCNFDIGITLCRQDNKLKNVVCINGELSPIKSKDNNGWETPELSKKVYKTLFYFAVNSIKKGIFKLTLWNNIKLTYCNVTKEHADFRIKEELMCSFNQ